MRFVLPIRGYGRARQLASGDARCTGRASGSITMTPLDATDPAHVPPSIFERIPQPPPVLAESDMEMFRKLASPSDVPLQFQHAARARLRDVNTWEILSASAVKSLRYLRISEVAAVLDSCAQMSWRDEHLLCGLSESLRCGAELRRGTVRDYAQCCQALRRLGYCPWPGALRPIVAELRWRLHRHRWRCFDLVYVLRFVAEFGLHTLPRLPQAGALHWELKERAEGRLGEMRHIELAHFARALAAPQDLGSTTDVALLSRISENFSRRADDLPLGVLLHFTASLIRARVPAPEEFRRVLAKRAAADLSRMRPFEIAFLVTAMPRLEIRDPVLLRQLDRAVSSNMDRFTSSQVAATVEAFDLLGHRHRALVDYIEHVLFSPTAGDDRGFSSAPALQSVRKRDRCRLLAALVGAAAATPGRRNRSADAIGKCVAELSQTLQRLSDLGTGQVAVAEDAASHQAMPGRHPALGAPKPPGPLRREAARRRGTAVNTRSVRTTLNTRDEERTEKMIGLEAWDPQFMGGAQLDALNQIAGSLPVGLAELPICRGDEPGVTSATPPSKRLRRRPAAMVPSFVPAGSSVIKARPSRRRNHLDHILGGHHPASRRLRRRLLRLERELRLETANAVMGDEPKMRNPLRRSSPRGATAHARAAILWRRLRRYRLGAFVPENCIGRFEGRGGDSLRYQRPDAEGLKLDHVVVLCETLATDGGKLLPGRNALLEQLARYTDTVLPSEVLDTGGPHRHSVLPVTARIASVMAGAELGSSSLISCLERVVSTHVTANSKQGHPGYHPRALARMLIAYCELARTSRQQRTVRANVEGDNELCFEQADARGHASTVPKPRQDETIRILLNQLLLDDKSRNGAKSLWSLSSDEVAAVLSSLAACCQDSSLLDLRWRARLWRGIRAILGRDSLACGGEPLSAKTVTKLIAAWLWLRHREGFANVSSAPLPHTMLEACNRWAIGAKRVQALLHSWVHDV